MADIANLLLAVLGQTYLVAREAAPYLILGTVLAGLVRTFLKPDQLRRWLAPRDFKSVLRAAVVGVPLPLCSCSVLPVARQIHRAGASRGATSTFLIATPESGVDSFVLSWGLLNPAFAIARVVGAFITSIIAGILQNRFGGPDPAPPEPGKGSGGMAELMARLGQKPPTLSQRLAEGQRYAFTDLLAEMAPAFLLGLLATGAVMAAIPPDLLERFLGGSFFGMVAVAFIGMASYICASSATPLAAALVLKGMSPGTALVLLLAGPATSLASMAAVRDMLGTRGLVIYVGSIVVCAVALGMGLDWIDTRFALGATLIDGGKSVADHMGHASHVFGVALLAFLSFHTARIYRARWKKRHPAPKPAAAPARPPEHAR